MISQLIMYFLQKITKELLKLKNKKRIIKMLFDIDIIKWYTISI
jgi:hypothetical protein